MATTVAELIAEARGSSDWRTRRLALIGLGYRPDHEILPVLLEALDDPISDVRHAAILALGRRGDRDAMAELLRPKIIAAPEANIRWAATTALGKLGDHRIIDQLVGLVHDEEWLVRNEALVVLREKVAEIIARRDMKLARVLVRMLNIPDAGIVETAVEGLRDLGRDASPLLAEAADSVREHIRRHAAQVMGLIGDFHAVPLLVRALGDESPPVRVEAATALGRIGGAAALRPLLTALADFDDEVRSATRDALVRLGEEAVSPLIIELEHTHQKLAKSAAIEALGAIGDPRAIPILIQHLGSTYHLVRKAAVASLPAYGAAVVPLLRGMLSYNRSDISGLLSEVQSAADLHTRMRAARALGDLEDHRAVPVLTSLLSDDERELALAAQEALGKIGCAAWSRRGAATVLGRVGDPSMVSQVLELLEDDSINVRLAAVISLGDLRAKEHLNRLARQAETDPAPLVRYEALDVLRELAPGSQQLFDTALEAIEDTSVEVRVRATRIIGDYPDERAVGPLFELLSDPSLGVRMSAETALVTQGRPVVPGLVHILQYGPMVARRRAASALGRIEDPAAIPPLEEAIAEDDDPGTVDLARESVRHLRGTSETS